MSRVKPLQAMIAVGAFMALVLTADQFSRGRRAYSAYERVGPDADGVVRLDVGDLERLEVRFYRFLNSGNQEVRFLVGRDREGIVQVGFDANDSHYKTDRGFSYQDGWVIDNKCETTTRLSAINQGGKELQAGRREASRRRRPVADHRSQHAGRLALLPLTPRSAWLSLSQVAGLPGLAETPDVVDLLEQVRLSDEREPSAEDADDVALIY